MSLSTYPQLVFPNGFDDRDKIEVPWRGYYGPAVVELSANERYAVSFYDPTRLKQDLETVCANGGAYIAEPGLIIVPEVTKEAMCSAVERLVKEGFFQNLLPLDDDRFRRIFPLLR